ncbi:alpha/beta hydrolase (plasmid) [Kovacikia minuta CCNUW1]|uniref:alpha/beta hydrolase n=1 Tax=Kovacikia minuta TaxID=2931930 RepID=UPI001CCE4C50|nr:alpha/beta hydrolase [Kovacikia minuta]UBF30030.1 alpha/beta hydrolase [Kovacikia minuta CCNUW1]
MLSLQSFQRSLIQRVSRFVGLSGVLLLGVNIGVLGPAVPTLAAERVILTYGIFQEQFSVQDMQTFAETGELSRLRQFQLRIAGADPEVLRGFLNQKLRVNFLFLDRTLNSLPGEYLLHQVGQVIHNRRRVAPIQSLRSALVLSAREDNTVSLLEFLQNYPLPEVYLDGKKLAEIGQKVGNTRAKVERYLETMAVVVQQILSEPLCACESEVGAVDESNTLEAVKK